MQRFEILIPSKRLNDTTVKGYNLPTLMSIGQPLCFAVDPSLEMGWAKSGV